MAYRCRVTHSPTWRRTLLSAVAVTVISGSLAGCLHDKDGTASIADGGRSPEALRAQADSWGKRYGANPGEKTASLGYARALAALDQKEQAVAVLQAAAIKSPKDQVILAAYGKALVDTGDYNQALEVLARSHSPDQPDWRILSAEGIASDGIGLHDRAQSFYLQALKIAPGDPGVMSNLGLSYALARKLPGSRTHAERGSADAERRSARAPKPRLGAGAAGTLRHRRPGLASRPFIG